MISNKQQQLLIEAACAARASAYAPYSNFKVGAAILTESGEIVRGVNVENASYGLTVCAERSAISQMVLGGAQRLQAVAVCTENGVAPCGACRQVLAEFADDVPVFLVDTKGAVRQTTLLALLPEHFSPNQLP